MKKAKNTQPEEPKYAVVQRSYVGDLWRTCCFFSREDAAAWAARCGGRLFGLSPEYEVTQTISVTLKEQ